MEETPEEQLRKRVLELSESEIQSPVHPSGVSIQEFMPYLLIKILERLEAIEASLDSINSSITDFWNSKYNS